MCHNLLMLQNMSLVIFDIHCYSGILPFCGYWAFSSNDDSFKCIATLVLLY